MFMYNPFSQDDSITFAESDELMDDQRREICDSGFYREI